MPPPNPEGPSSVLRQGAAQHSHIEAQSSVLGGNESCRRSCSMIHHHQVLCSSTSPTCSLAAQGACRLCVHTAGICALPHQDAQ